MTSSLRALALAFLGVVAGCADNPVTPETHFEARGVLLEQTAANGADTTVVTVDSNRVTGGLVLERNGTERAFTVRFIGDDGTPGLPAANADGSNDHDLAITIADTTVAGASAITRWGFRLRGRAAGTTSLTVHLLHGGHDDFVSVAIPIEVRP